MRLVKKRLLDEAPLLLMLMRMPLSEASTQQRLSSPWSGEGG